MNHSAYVGWDIGGAHLKVACVNETGQLDFVEQYATPLWQGLNQLEDKFPEVFIDLPPRTMAHAVTMTAELADIFSNREEGIKNIVALSEKKLGKAVSFYSSESHFLTTNKYSNLIASANWHASATYVANKIDAGIFVDIGSTTTDIIPIVDRKLINRGNDDQSRMHYGELVYTGVIRTPLMALSQKAPFNGSWQSIAAEHFSTTADIYRILDKIQDADDLMETADGKSKDVPASIRRLGRMLGMDVTDTSESYQWIQLAEYFSNRQIQMVTDAIAKILSSSFSKKPVIVGAGVGSFLISKIAANLELDYINFFDLLESDKKLKHKCNTCAPAVALAHLNRLNHLK